MDNSYAAWPPMRGLGRYYECRLTVVGPVDPVTGYMVNIKLIDAATRSRILPVFSRFAQQADAPLGQMMRQALDAVRDRLPHPVTRISLQLAPTYAITLQEHDMSACLISQTYDFSAAHRLHCDALSDDENRATFGKCNNPSGHGHNYRLEVTVAAPIDAAGHITPVETLDAIVNAHIIEAYDHKHLNIDTPAFAEMNSSVENIVRVFYETLTDPLESAGLKLDAVRVWETEKTVACYRA